MCVTHTCDCVQLTVCVCVTHTCDCVQLTVCERVCDTYTTFSLTQFGSVISLGTVTKRSMNEAEPCRIDPHWDLLTEPGQHGSVRSFGECEHFYNRANCFQSDERATDGVCVCVCDTAAGGDP